MTIGRMKEVVSEKLRFADFERQWFNEDPPEPPHTPPSSIILDDNATLRTGRYNTKKIYFFAPEGWTPVTAEELPQEACDITIEKVEDTDDFGGGGGKVNIRWRNTRKFSRKLSRRIRRRRNTHKNRTLKRNTHRRNTRKRRSSKRKSNKN